MAMMDETFILNSLLTSGMTATFCFNVYYITQSSITYNIFKYLPTKYLCMYSFLWTVYLSKDVLNVYIKLGSCFISLKGYKPNVPV